MPPVDGYVSLICPPGGQENLASHGAFGWQAYPDPGNPGRWLVDVPAAVAPFFCNGVAGFVALEREKTLPSGGAGM
jgi:hypothetical protein